MKREKHLGLLIDAELHHKLRYVSAYDGRSASGEIIYVLRRYIAEFEAANGPVPPMEQEE